LNIALLKKCCRSLPPAHAPYAVVRATDQGVECEGTPECAYGDGAPSEGSLLGRFCAGWSIRNGCFLAATDAQGNAPLFYARIHGGVAVSNNAIRLLAAGISSEMDYPALAQLMTVNFVTGGRTLFSEIKILPPGGVLSLTPQGEIHVAASDLQIPSVFSGTPEDAAQLYAELFEAAMGRTPTSHGRTGTPLSGGRDSRMIAAALKRSGYDRAEVLTLSRADQADRSDAVVAEQVADALGIPIQRTGIASPGTIAEVWKNVLCSCLTLQHGWLSHVWIESARRFDTVYDGFGCGVATRTSHRIDDLYRLISSGDFRGTALRYSQNIKTRPTDAGLPNWLDRYPSIEAVEKEGLGLLESDIRSVQHAPDPMGAMSMYCENRRAITLSPNALCMLGARVKVPLADDDLFRHTMSLPRELTDQLEPQTRAIAILYPELAKIPYSNGSGPVQRRGFGRLVKSAQPSEVRSKLLDVLMDPSYQFRSFVSSPVGGRAMAARVRSIGMLLQKIDSSGGAVELLEACNIRDKPPASMISLARNVWDSAWKIAATSNSESSSLKD